MYSILLLLLLLCLLCFFASTCAVDIKDMKNTKDTKDIKDTKGVVLIFARPTFHEEVVSSVACILHQLNYYTVVYIGTGIHIGQYKIPFSDARWRKSQEFYGKCVSKFVTVTKEAKIDYHPKFVVFVTPPFNLVKRIWNDFEGYLFLRNLFVKYFPGTLPSDPQSIDDDYRRGLLFNFGDGDLNIYNSTIVLNQIYQFPKVAFILHKFGELAKLDVARLHVYVPIQKMILMFLADHVLETASRHVADTVAAIPHHQGVLPSMISFVPLFPRLHLISSPGMISNLRNYLVPVKEKKLVATIVKAKFNQSAVSTSVSRRVFALQGNFGGRHSNRRHPSVIFECIRRVLESGQIQVADGRGKNSNNDKSSGLLHHQYLQQCPLSMQLIGKLHPPLDSIVSLPSINVDNDTSYHRIELSRGSDETNLYTSSVALRNNLRHSANTESSSVCSLDVSTIDSAPPSMFYNAISQAHFVVGAVEDDKYYDQKATSSVPTALSYGIPFVGGRKLISLYSCLNSTNNVHSNFNLDSECDSIAAAAALSDIDYAMAREEVQLCANVLLNEAISTFEKLIMQ